jgi:hypothetical protein
MYLSLVKPNAPRFNRSNANYQNWHTTSTPWIVVACTILQIKVSYIMRSSLESSQVASNPSFVIHPSPLRLPNRQYQLQQ